MVFSRMVERSGSDPLPEGNVAYFIQPLNETFAGPKDSSMIPAYVVIDGDVYYTSMGMYTTQPIWKTFTMILRFCFEMLIGITITMVVSTIA